MTFSHYQYSVVLYDMQVEYKFEKPDSQTKMSGIFNIAISLEN